MADVVRSAKVILRDSEGYVLVLRRSDTHPFVPLTPDLPGGKIESRETIVEGVVRELSEEIGFTVDVALLKKIDESDLQDYFGKLNHIELFELKVPSRPMITLDFEHDKYDWVELKKLTHVGKAYVPLIEAYKTSNA